MPRMRTTALAMILACAGCAAQPHTVSTTPADTTPQPGGTDMAQDGLSRARLNQTVAVGGPKVTALEVLEDSRCPMNARCVWAGRVRLRARINLGSGSQIRDLIQGEPLPIADGTLELVEVQPDRGARSGTAEVAPADYRFGFRFMGGL